MSGVKLKDRDRLQYIAGPNDMEAFLFFMKFSS